MQKRKIIIGQYDTALEGQWTLTGWALGRAEARESYVDIPGHSGQLDLSDALTDGEVAALLREVALDGQSCREVCNKIAAE